MSQPQTIGAYLAALNASIEVGLRSRRRILFEVVDHLSQSMQEEVRRGAGAEEAQRRALAAFGSPEEVAAHFERGLIGWLDRRLALGARWLHRWTTRRPARGAVMWMALGAFLAGVVAAVGTSFEARQPVLAATAFLAAGTAWALMQIVLPSWRRRFRAGARAWQVELIIFFAYPSVGGYLTMVDGDFGGVNIVGWLALVYTTVVLAQGSIERAVKRAAQRYAGATEHDACQVWRADHPWHAAVADVAPLPLGVVMLIVVHSGPGGLRTALAVLAVAMAALAVGAVRLEQSRQQKEDYQRAYGDGAT